MVSEITSDALLSAEAEIDEFTVRKRIRGIFDKEWLHSHAAVALVIVTERMNELSADANFALALVIGESLRESLVGVGAQLEDTVLLISLAETSLLAGQPSRSEACLVRALRQATAMQNVSLSRYILERIIEAHPRLVEGIPTVDIALQ